MKWDATFRKFYLKSFLIAVLIQAGTQLMMYLMNGSDNIKYMFFQF